MTNNIRTMLIASSAIVHLPMVFEPGKSGWKMTADGKSIEMKDGNPIWIEADGSERTLQSDTITRVNGEARQHREAKEKAEGELVKFKGIDPEKARAALETITKIDQKKLIDAGEVDKVRNEIKTEYETKFAEKDKAFNTLQSEFDNMRIGGVFSNSSFVRDQIAIPSDMFQSHFRANFKIEDGKVTAYGKDGNRIMSKAKIGEYAEPDEALEILVAQHPQRDVILKPSNHSGSGNNGTGGHRPGQRFIKRSEYDQLAPHEQAKTAIAAGKGEISIID